MACNGRHPRVGIFAIITNQQGQILIGRRLSKLGQGHWGFPGGHLEQGEDFATCVQRETFEETGLRVTAGELAGVTNDRFDSDKHYVTIFMRCDREDGQQQPEVLEPEKCESWTWKSWEDLQRMAKRVDGVQELFLPVENFMLQEKSVC
ncbi:NUDIX hydrolase domain-like protein [Microdochium bolleyi]|uniref:NUDIX hydrolase domain-like protein n=1 Tax=Microdochium bolleyi TaxID=196109 RepID=A0A136IQF4_9PEZI|nr:NUDIX hydrolase domain-like protein [Microdochium bolleyi]